MQTPTEEAQNEQKRSREYTFRYSWGVATRQVSEDLHSLVCDVVDLLWDLLGAEPSFIPMKVAQCRMKQMTLDFRVWEQRYRACAVAETQAELPLGLFRQFPSKEQL